eukprot:COSAG01_NODE_40707_length_460_cov_1.939058_1_plen_24_part_10
MGISVTVSVLVMEYVTSDEVSWQL